MLGIFFGFNGRINRATYWLGNVFVSVFAFFGMMFAFMLAGSQGFDKSTASALRVMSTMGLVLFPVFLVMGWAGMALQVKRFHDRGRSGLFTLIPFIPVFLVIMAVINGAMSNAPLEQVMGEAGLYMNILMLINLWFFIDLGCLAGKEGPNKFGDPPRGGFGLGRAGPSSPGAPVAPGRPAAAPTASLGGAEVAMQRAIAEQAKPRQPQAAPAPSRAAAPMASRPAMAHAPAGAPAGFGRKPAR